MRLRWAQLGQTIGRPKARFYSALHRLRAPTGADASLNNSIPFYGELRSITPAWLASFIIARSAFSPRTEPAAYAPAVPLERERRGGVHTGARCALELSLAHTFRQYATRWRHSPARARTDCFC
jgi:hypothetical protein